MKVALVTNFLYPEGLGGTELYCQQLADALISLGHHVYWFVPNFNKTVTATEQRENGLAIVRFAAIDEGNTGTGEEFVASSFVYEMKQRVITIAHFNEFGGGAGINGYVLEQAKKAGIRTIVTMHLVHYICQTGTLRYGGLEKCDGKVIPSRCGSCNIFFDATTAAPVNLAFSKFFQNLFKVIEKNKLYILPKMKQVIRQFNNKAPFLAALKNSADVVVTLTEWFREVLTVNGINQDKIVYMPQATPKESIVQNTARQERSGYVYIGRINHEKGVDLLLRVAQKLRHSNPHIKIDLFGPIYTHNKFASHFVERVGKLDNINYRDVLDPAEVLNTISRYKAVLLPSYVAEMAPLIIMEANRLRIPVIVSDVPGSVELVKQYDCGLVFNYADVNDLADKIVAIENNVHHFQFKQPAENEFTHIALKYLRIYQADLLSQLQHD